MQKFQQEDTKELDDAQAWKDPLMGCAIRRKFEKLAQEAEYPSPADEHHGWVIGIRIGNISGGRVYVVAYDNNVTEHMLEHEVLANLAYRLNQPDLEVQVSISLCVNDVMIKASTLSGQVLLDHSFPFLVRLVMCSLRSTARLNAIVELSCQMEAAFGVIVYLGCKICCASKV